MHIYTLWGTCVPCLLQSAKNCKKYFASQTFTDAQTDSQGDSYMYTRPKYFVLQWYKFRKKKQPKSHLFSFFQIRKRRFLQGYDMLTDFPDVWYNILGNDSYEYEDKNSEDEDNNDEDDFGTGTFYYGAELSNETKFSEVFTNLYMDINM